MTGGHQADDDPPRGRRSGEQQPWQHLLALVAARWPELRADMPEQEHIRLRNAARQWRSAGYDPLLGEQLAHNLAALLPRFDATRLSDVLAPDGYLAEDLAVVLLDGHALVGPVLGAVRRRLLAAPAFDPEQVAAHGADPFDPKLIRLAGPEGLRLPAFQFDASGAPRAALTEVNGLLDAADDPWGAADWWLSVNAWLGTAPCELLGSDDRARLLDAARDLTEGE